MKAIIRRKSSSILKIDCTEDELVRFYKHYDKGEAPVHIWVSEITMETPFGMYILED